VTVNRFWWTRRRAVSLWGGGGAVEQVDVVGAVANTVPEHGNDAVFGDFPVQPGQELAAGRAVLVKPEGGGGPGLGGVEKRAELDQIQAVFPVVVVPVARCPAAAPWRCRFADGRAGGGITEVAGEGLANEAFQTPFADIGGHGR